MQTSGIKIDINSSDKLLVDNSEKIQKIIKFAVKQAVLQKGQRNIGEKRKESKKTDKIRNKKKLNQTAE